jgi:hypothetical protein
MAAVVLGSLQRRRKQRGEGMLAAARGGEKRGLGFAGRFKGQRCAALVEEEDSRARRGRAGDVSWRAHALSVGWKMPERELGLAGIKEERRRARWTEKRWTPRGFFLLLSFSSSLCLAELFWGKGEVPKERV